MRKPLDLNMTVEELVITMAEGNPGGLSALMKLLEDKDGLAYVLHLDDMNIRGPQIWVGYKDFCNFDLEKFKKLISERSSELISAINKEMFMDPGWKHMAEKHARRQKEYPWNIR